MSMEAPKETLQEVKAPPPLPPPSLPPEAAKKEGSAGPSPLEVYKEVVRLNALHEAFDEWAEGAVQLLPKEEQDFCFKVKETGVGVCSKCRYSHGCMDCSFAKAVRAYLRAAVEKEHGKLKVRRGRVYVYGGGSQDTALFV